MEVKQIPLSSVIPSPMNPRKTFDEVELQELADNIERQGLLQPITVRPLAASDGSDESGPQYEIICWERRFRAVSKLSAKWSVMDCIAPKGETYNQSSKISAIVREMNDDEAFDAMITENLQRKDVDPMEEAFAFGQLINKGKTAEEVAARFGKSLRFVQNRIKLNSLIPELMLLVKEEKMSIAAAMIICKLTEEEQRRYFSQFPPNPVELNKRSAESFVDALFMTISRASWFNSDNQEDENFTGGCDRACSECQFNTANHGCLFYEMKSNDPGRCTNRENFQAKTITFALREIDDLAPELVKAGEPMAQGKMVIADFKAESYESESLKILKETMRQALTARGFELVNPDKIFRSKCYYRADDERTIKALETGEAYRVLRVFNYDKLVPFEEFWYLKRESEDAPVESGAPAAVATILSQIHSEETALQNKLTCEGAKAINSEAVPTNAPLTEIEKQLFCLLTLQTSYKLRGILGCKPGALYRDDAYALIAEHPDMFNQCIRTWLQSKVSPGNNPELHMAEPMLDALGALWCADAYQEAKDKTIAKHEKAMAKLTKQLHDLGYDTDGKPNN